MCFCSFCSSYIHCNPDTVLEGGWLWVWPQGYGEEKIRGSPFKELGCYFYFRAAMILPEGRSHSTFNIFTFASFSRGTLPEPSTIMLDICHLLQENCLQSPVPVSQCRTKKGGLGAEKNSLMTGTPYFHVTSIIIL